MAATSSLSHLTATSSVPTLPSDRPEPSRKVTTYGRRVRRAETPEEDGRAGLFWSETDTSEPRGEESEVAGLSHTPLSKMKRSSSAWRDSLGSLGLAEGDADREEEEDEEELKRQMEKLRREARGEILSPVEQVEPVSPKEPSTPLPAANSIPTNNQLQVDVHSSTQETPPGTLNKDISLKQISLPPSSPPRRTPSSIVPSSQRSLSAYKLSETEGSQEESQEVVSGKPGKARRVVVSSDEEEDDEVLDRNARRSPARSATATASPSPPLFTPIKKARASKKVEETSSLTALTESQASISKDLNDDDLPKWASDDEEEQDISVLVRNQEEQEAAELERQEEREIKKAKGRSHEKTDVLVDMEDLWSDDDEEPKKAINSKKGLNKKELKIVHQDIAAAERGRSAHLSKPEPKRLDMYTFINNYSSNQKGPTKVDFKLSPSHQPYPFAHGQSSDPIATFTSSPSASSRRPRTQGVAPKEARASPTRAPLRNEKTIEKDTAVHEEDEAQDITALLEQESKKDEREDARKRLYALKLQIMKDQAKSRSSPLTVESKDKANDGDDSDSDFEVVDDRTPDVHGLSGTARANTTVKYKTITEYEPSRKIAKESLTETYVAHAATTVGHANAKNFNAGSRRPGMKKGRDNVITHDQLSRKTMMSAQEQARMVMRTKERQRGVGRVLPPKQQLDLQSIAQRQAREEENDDEMRDDGDEDGEDEDWAPEEEGALQYSGEEDDGPDEEVANGTAEEGADDEDQEDHEGDEIEPASTSTPRASVRISGFTTGSGHEDDILKIEETSSLKRIVASDDEDESAAPVAQTVIASAPAATIPPKSPPKASALASAHDAPAFYEDSELDLAGFDGGGGFSQLFDGTQDDNPSDTEAAGEDAFAKLRNAGQAGLIPTQAMLPHVHISDSQIARDDAFVAAVYEEAAMARARERELELGGKKKMYMNTQGLFTQTKPEDLDLDLDVSTPSGKSQGGYSNFGPTPSFLRKSQRSEDGDDRIGTSNSRSDEEDDEEDMPRKRVIRRKNPPSDTSSWARSRSGSLSPMKAQELEPTQISSGGVRSVADVLGAGAHAEHERQWRHLSNKHTAGHVGGKKVTSKLIDVEANESDEDTPWFTNPNEDEGDEDDEDGQDGYVEGLVDDQHVTEAERERDDELRAQKRREIEEQDEAKRLAEAEKIAKGEHRTKKRGHDFDSDDSDDDGKVRYRKLGRRNRARNLDVEKSGLLPNEKVVFSEDYKRDLEASDHESDVEEYHIPSERVGSTPEKENRGARISYMERQAKLRQLGKMNEEREHNPNLDEDMDVEIGLGHVDDDIPEVVVSRGRRSGQHMTQPIEDDEFGRSQSFNNKRVTRDPSSYEDYIQNQQYTNRGSGGGGSGKGSVVRTASLVASASNAGGGGAFGGARGGGGRGNGRALPSRSSTMSSTGLSAMAKRDRFD